MHDVIIIGAGAAGMSAAWWCAELGLKTLLVERERAAGGQLLWVYNPIENYLGIRARNGRALQKIFARHLARAACETLLHADVTDVNLSAKEIVTTTGMHFNARYLILATGVRRRVLGVTGETKLRGRGVLHSGKKDGVKYAGKTVVVVGGGDAAAENALILSEHCAQIFLVCRGKQLRARAEFTTRIRQTENIRVMLESEVRHINGARCVESVAIKTGGHSTETTLATDGVLVRIGVMPNTELVQSKLALDENGYIKVDHKQETSVKSVFAIGDVANPLGLTVQSATGAGATAAKIIGARESELNKR